ncbi:B3/4 domain-containing protein [Streptococcus halotolerans]|uniref:B3/B4 domain-containing protein n=1 Tax=Streptococcus halotolerans TaxID=1814128 RepID=UPI00078914C2|nr:B3/4 domain-containing protein [Streptococcus halotolerans]
MGTFIVDSSYWELFPDSKIGVVLIKDYQMKEELAGELEELLKLSNQKAKSHLQEDQFSQNDVVQTYRKAYQKFKTKKGARSSIEALLKRVDSDKPVSTISPLVDIYNSASLTYALPVGAEDIDTFQGDLKLTITEGGDEFYLIGDEENRPTLAGELAYIDDAGAVCRCFNWRDGERTMITDNTKNAFLVIELVDATKEDSLKEALNFIEEKANYFLSAKTHQTILDKDSTQLDLD